MNERTWGLVKAGLIAGGAFVLVLIIGNLPFLFLFELKGLDLLFLLRGALPPPPEIVIVAIDEPSFAQVSKQWPWPRSVHAQLIEKLEKAGAKVIGFDVLFTEESQPEDDRALQRAIQKAANVVLVSEQVVINDPVFRYTSRVDPIESLKEVAKVGLSSLQIYPDGSVRRARLAFPDIPSFSLQVARLYLGDQSSQRIETRSHGGNGARSFDPSAELLINYLGPPRTVKTVSYYQALDYERTLPPGVFAGKIVLVGRSTEADPEPERSAPDVFQTPFLLSSGALTPGVEIHATIISNILTGRFVHELPPWGRLVLLVLLALLGSALHLKLRPLASLAMTFVLAALLLLGASVLFVKHDLWIPIVGGSLALGFVYSGHLVDKLVTERRAKERIKGTFETYVDPRIVREIISNSKATTTGEKQIFSVLFADMEKFSSISEQMTPAGLVNMVNRYLTLASESIRKNHGIIDKYIGDAIMAFWGPPFTNANDHAKFACLAALDQLAILNEFRRMLPDITGFRTGLPVINVRAGVATGEVIVGNIGSEFARNYTVMGDTVNVASRLEGASKQYGTRLLISQQTEVMARDAIETRELDAIRVVGRSEPMRIFELLARKGELDQAGADLRGNFGLGLGAYRDRDWNAAKAHFAACLKITADDSPSKLFLGRLQYLHDHPPAEDWDGVWSLTEK